MSIDRAIVVCLMRTHEITDVREIRVCSAMTDDTGSGLEIFVNLKIINAETIFIV